MVQTTNAYIYKGKTIYQMHDTGAYWYETEDGATHDTYREACAWIEEGRC